jgi:hypothetical protein
LFLQEVFVIRNLMAIACWMRIYEYTMNMVRKFHIPELCYWDKDYVSFRIYLNYIFQIRLLSLSIKVAPACCQEFYRWQYWLAWVLISWLWQYIVKSCNIIGIQVCFVYNCLFWNYYGLNDVKQRSSSPKS